MSNDPNEALRYHVSGAIERGEAEPIIGLPTVHRVNTEPDLYACPDCAGILANGTLGYGDDEADHEHAQRMANRVHLSELALMDHEPFPFSRYACDTCGDTDAGARFGVKVIADDAETRDGHPATCPAVVWSDGICTCQTDDAEDYDMLADWWTVSRCPACGDPIDYCQGHGLIGDPVGHLTLQAHDKGRHEWCNAFGCEEVRLGK